ncbi:MAG: hypothetical protein PVH85_32585 [Desulfobacterales bacterium]|jgi:hypothetical protein
MKWLEFIRVQVGGNPQETIASKILSFTKELKYKPGLTAAEVYVHALVNGDFAISLLWDTDQPQPMGSLIGLNIKDALRKYGLVDHSAWIKKQGS